MRVIGHHKNQISEDIFNCMISYPWADPEGGTGGADPPGILAYRIREMVLV